MASHSVLDLRASKIVPISLVFAISTEVEGRVSPSIVSETALET